MIEGGIKLTHYYLVLLMCPLFIVAQPQEEWVDLPVSKWPTIALTKHVQYQNGDTYIDPAFAYAGTGFLIDTGTDTLAATTNTHYGLQATGQRKMWKSMRNCSPGRCDQRTIPRWKPGLIN